MLELGTRMVQGLGAWLERDARTRNRMVLGLGA